MTKKRDWPKPKPVAERFWPKVDKSADCWVWTGAKDVAGYGRIHVEGKSALAHRVSYAMANGPIPEKLVIDHMCYNPPCVNPAHLQAVTQRQNTENRGGLDRNNTSGVRGVCWSKHRGKWIAYVGHGKDRVYVGYFTDLKQAEEAVVAKRNELYTNNLRDRDASFPARLAA